jgi:hypothetical protein
MAHRVKCPTCGSKTPNETFCQYCGKPLYSCKYCNTSIIKDVVFCHSCGAVVTGDGKELKSQEHVSWIWWLLPVICPFVNTLPWVGGVVAWALNRQRDPHKAISMLWFGVSLTIVMLIIIISVFVSTYVVNN